MPSFVPGSGALSLRDNINSVAAANGCNNYIDYSIWGEWNNNYAFEPDFTAPYNMGFFYGAGCPAYLHVSIDFYADPYNDNIGSWGVYYKVGTTGTETFISSLSVDRVYYYECITYIVTIPTKSGIGQSGNDVYVGIRNQGKGATPAEFFGEISNPCPGDVAPGYCCGTYDYGGYPLSGFMESAVTTTYGITVRVDKSGYVVTC